MKNLNVLVCLFVLFLNAVSSVHAATQPVYSQQVPVPVSRDAFMDGSVRNMGDGPNGPVTAAYTDIVKLRTMQLPETIEKGFREGYGQIEVLGLVSAGYYKSTYCGGFLVDEKERLVITCWHGMPPYVDQLNEKYIRFRGVPARVVASLPKADLALLRLEKVPQGMHALSYREAVVGDTLFARSLQTLSLGDQARVADTIKEPIYFQGEITATGSVLSKGMIVLPPVIPTDDTAPTTEMRQTKYEMLYTQLSTQSGFSGSPVFNEWAQVVGVVTSSDGGISFISSAANFQFLFKEFESKKK